MSFFDEVETTVANTRFLQAVEDNGPIVLSLTPYEELKEFECDFVKGLTCRRLLKWESVGYYLFKQFLEKDAEYQKKHIASVTSTQQASPSHTSTHLHPSSASTHDRHECKEDVLSLLQTLDDYMRVHEGQRKRHALRVMNNTLHYLKPSDLDKDVIPGEMPSSQILVKTTSGSISSELSTETMEAIHTVKMQTNMMVHLPEEGSQHRSSRDVEEMKENEKISTPISTPTAVQMMKESKKTALLAADDGRIGPTSSQLDDEVEGSPTVLITTVTPPPSKEGQSKSSFTAPGLPGAANSTPATTTPTASASNTLASTSSSTVPTIAPGSSFLSQLLPTCRPILNNIWRQLESSHPPPTLFDPLRDAIADLLHDPFIRFLTTDAYKKYIQLEHYARKTVQLKDFRVFRVLGRGAFGAVSAVQKIDTHAIFAMKEMGKKQVKMNQSEWMVLNEKKVLSKMRSPFVLNLKYSFHNEENLYLIFDMCSGGDLKFHLRGGRDKFFDNDRARFYAAEVLLGLEHIHSFDIVYRDLKPNNILLDMNGHVKISDLGLTIRLRKNKVLKHLAGTAGYWAPEIVMKKGTYKSSDYWSFATFLYEMLAGKRPTCNCQKKTNEWCPFGQKRSMEENALKDDGVLKMEIDYPSDKFTPEAKDLLEKLFEFDPAKRLGANGAHEIKSHPYFSCIDWHALQALEVEPPFIPDGRTVNANSIGEVGEFNKGKFKKIKLTEEDEKAYAGFDYINEEAVQQELVQALKKQDNPSTEPQLEQNKNPVGTGCCVML